MSSPFDNKERGNFFTILNGKFAQRVQEGTIGAVSRVNKTGKLVFEKYYESFTAKLVDVKRQEGGPYGTNWLFSFQAKDSDEIYILQLGYSNSYATAFLKMLPNIDLSQEMTLEPDAKEVDGKTKSSLFVKQNGVSVKHKYTKENPNGLPPLEQVTVRGQLTWDDTKRLEFLYQMVQASILPKLPRAVSIAPAEQAVQSDLSIDDIPTNDELEKQKALEEDPF